MIFYGSTPQGFVYPDPRGRMLALHPALDRRGGGFGSSKAAGAWRPRSCLDAANMGGPAISFRKNWETYGKLRKNHGIFGMEFGKKMEETMGFVPANGACP